MNAQRFARLFGAMSVATVALFAATAAPAQTRLDLAVFHPERNAFTFALKWWIDEVEKTTEGRVVFKPHYSAALVSMNETFKAVRDGSIPMGVVASGAISGQMPGMAYIEAMGGMPSDVNGFNDAIAQLRPVLDEYFQRQGLVFTWTQPSWGLNVVCRDKHLKLPADWRGQKVRTAGRWQAEQTRALGGAAISMDPGEQYIGLQTRTIDCALSINTLVSAFRLTEVAPKVTLLRLPVNMTNYIVHPPTWAKIAEADRATIKRLGFEAEKKAADHIFGIQAEAIAQIRALKGDVYELADPELDAFKSAIRPVFAKMDGETGEFGKRIADVLRRYW